MVFLASFIDIDYPNFVNTMNVYSTCILAITSHDRIFALGETWDLEHLRTVFHLFALVCFCVFQGFAQLSRQGICLSKIKCKVLMHFQLTNVAFVLMPSWEIQQNTIFLHLKGVKENSLKLKLLNHSSLIKLIE